MNPARGTQTTRLRFLRNLTFVAILILAAALALAQFTNLKALAAGLLASGAIVAAVIGLAAQQVLANTLAGITLAITQPIRIGDFVEFADREGIVEELRLTHTFLRTFSGERIVIPNSQLAAGVLRNETILGPTVPVAAAIWVANGVDIDRACSALEQLDEAVSVEVTDSTADGIQLTVNAAPTTPGQRHAAEAGVRMASLRITQGL